MSNLMPYNRSLKGAAAFLALFVSAPTVFASGLQLGLVDGKPYIVGTNSSLPPGFSSQLPLPATSDRAEELQDLLVVGRISETSDSARIIAESSEILILPTTTILGEGEHGNALKPNQHVAVSGDFLGGQFGIARTIVILDVPLVPGASLTYRRHQDAAIAGGAEVIESIAVATPSGTGDVASLASAAVTLAAPPSASGKANGVSVARGISGSGLRGISGSGARARGISGSGLRGISGSGARARGISGSGLRGISGSGARARGISGSGLRGISGSGARARGISGSGLRGISGSGARLRSTADEEEL